MKSILIFPLFFAFNFFSKADKLTFATKAQADKVLKFLENQNELIICCSCCDNDKKRENYS